MKIVLLSFVLLLLARQWFQRYYPVKDIPERLNGWENREVIVLDIRDYNQSEKIGGDQYHNIPYAYLERFSKTIPNKPIHVIAENQLEINLGLRLLKKHGFNVKSYEIIHRKEKEGELKHGVR